MIELRFFLEGDWKPIAEVCNLWDSEISGYFRIYSDINELLQVLYHFKRQDAGKRTYTQMHYCKFPEDSLKLTRLSILVVEIIDNLSIIFTNYLSVSFLIFVCKSMIILSFSTDKPLYLSVLLRLYNFWRNVEILSSGIFLSLLTRT